MKHVPTELLNVWLEDDEPIRVGRLAWRERRIFFEYAPEFLGAGIEISPFELPLGLGIKEARPDPFDGLFGVFADSLPDGWGRLLLDRAVEKHGIPRGHLGPLDRLTYVGKRGMGAISYTPDRSGEMREEVRVSLDRIAEESRIVLAGDSEEVFEELLRLNGSSGGARPKITAQVSLDRKKIIHTGGALTPDYEHWMIKFALSDDAKDSGAVEYAYALMAKAAGIDMPPVHLFKTRRAAYFGVKRFDRDGDKRIHMHSLAGLIHADYRHPSLDYDTVMKVVFALTKNMGEVEKAFALACFNVLTHNRDDHARNFSFLLRGKKDWVFAPAYDLTFSHGPRGEQSTMLLGEGRSPGVDGLKQLGRKYAIKRAPQIIDRVRAETARWIELADQAGVTKRSASRIAKSLSNLP